MDIPVKKPGCCFCSMAVVACSLKWGIPIAGRWLWPWWTRWSIPFAQWRIWKWDCGFLDIRNPMKKRIATIPSWRCHLRLSITSSLLLDWNWLNRWVIPLSHNLCWPVPRIFRKIQRREISSSSSQMGLRNVVETLAQSVQLCSKKALFWGPLWLGWVQTVKCFEMPIHALVDISTLKLPRNFKKS